MPRPSPTPAKKDEVRSGKAKAASLLGSIQVSGSANPARIEARLRRLVPRLALRLRSLGAGQSGTVKLRLTLDASGRVARVAFVSGSLAMPSLKAELKRLLAGWTFGVLPERTQVVFSLQLAG